MKSEYVSPAEYVFKTREIAKPTRIIKLQSKRFQNECVVALKISLNFDKNLRQH